MRFRDILAVTTSGEDDSVVAVASQLALQNDGRLSAFVTAWMPVLILAEGWIASPVWGEVRSRAEARLQADLARLRRQLDAGTVPAGAIEGDVLDFAQVPAAVTMRAMHRDVAVTACAASDAQARLVEAALFASGRPVLLAPKRWKERQIGRNIVVAWKPTREAARAVAEADDLLADAAAVSIVRVDMDRTEDDCRAAGGEIADHFRRRHVHASACVLAPVGRSEARSILDHAEAIDADLIVMGGFGRSRMSEFVFGGMTREMMRSATIPVLMAH